MIFFNLRTTHFVLHMAELIGLGLTSTGLFTILFGSKLDMNCKIIFYIVYIASEKFKNIFSAVILGKEYKWKSIRNKQI